MRDQITAVKIPQSLWKALYIAGGAAAILAVLFFRRNTAVELVTFKGFGIFDVPKTWPVSAVDWFALLQQNRIIGLILLGLIDLINYALVGLIFLALFGALHGSNKGVMAAAMILGFVGIVVFFVSNQAFALLTLSDRYAAAATEAERVTILAAGEARLAIDNPGALAQGMGSYLSLFLLLLSGLIISIVMLSSTVFGKAAAYCGILANGIALCFFVTLAFAPAIAWLPPSFSAPLRIIWYILIAIGLFRLAARMVPESRD